MDLSLSSEKKGPVSHLRPSMHARFLSWTFSFGEVPRFGIDTTRSQERVRVGSGSYAFRFEEEERSFVIGKGRLL